MHIVIFSALNMFSKYEQRCFIKIQVARGINARQCHTELLEACGKETSPCRTVARWANAFRRGMEDVHQKCGAGRPQSSRDYVHVNAVRALLEEHRCWTSKGSWSCSWYDSPHT